MNKAILIGNLGKDPQITTLQSGVKKASFSIATTKKWTDKASGQRKEHTEWHNIVMWRGLAEVAEKWLHKGDKVMIEGEISTRKYTDSNNQEKYITEITANEMEMLSGRPQNGTSQQPQAQTQQNNPGAEIPLPF